MKSWKCLEKYLRDLTKNKYDYMKLFNKMNELVRNCGEGHKNTYEQNGHFSQDLFRENLKSVISNSDRKYMWDYGILELFVQTFFK